MKTLKKNLFSMALVAAVALGTALSVVPEKSEANVNPTGYFCKTSSDPQQNNGFCKALSSGHGDMCFTYGEGTACSGTGGGS